MKNSTISPLNVANNQLGYNQVYKPQSQQHQQSLLASCRFRCHCRYYCCWLLLLAAAAAAVSGSPASPPPRRRRRPAPADAPAPPPPPPPPSPLDLVVPTVIIDWIDTI